MLSILDEVLHYVKFYDNLLVILCIDIVSRPNVISRDAPFQA